MSALPGFQLTAGLDYDDDQVEFTGKRSVALITCRKMTAGDVADAFEMLRVFLAEDEHYLASSKAYGDRGFQGLNDALDLFLEQPELGFVWMAFDDRGACAVCVVCYAISTSMGAVVAKLDDVSVKAERRGGGIGSALLEQLKEQLRKEAVTRIDVGVHLENPEARRFYEKLGFMALNEERLACVI
jgi:ribosomal protein S18 acetylase RimI-like enzyme